MLTWTERLRDASRTLALASAVLVLVWSTGALAHETMGHFEPHAYGPGQYLYGRKIGDPKHETINCCTFGGNGDCHLYPISAAEEIDEGWRLGDGEVIRHEDVSVSPDGHFYRCRHAGKPSHCLFVPKRWG
jgi:hypothetical protein